MTAPAHVRSADRAAILGLVLDGGEARRMGGVDKGLMLLAGRPMIVHALERLRPQVAAVAISANGDPGRFARFGLAVLADDPPRSSGPLAGVLAGLELCARLDPSLTHVATLPADTPFAPQDYVERLRRALGAANAEIAVAVSGGRRHHAAALWSVALGPDLRRALVADGLRKVEHFATRYRLATVEWPVDPVDPFLNVNTPDDLARAEALRVAASGGRGGD